ncbi:hypothetical protein [Deinococcus hopiensis]|uniref:Uncharacterized protein n=1 Tax=Deinococcus hopiensis KR-140 TaxID=695939 RepID=A0A1W1VLD6_9DEIO|nr:hypothetical protein [Deinococcus hopiensis]SMB93774.1 hypothetical protein SAMN00790413_02109 [Deinococcus hopiensis KR-140]
MSGPAGAEEVREYVTLPGAPDADTVGQLLTTPGGAVLSARTGWDAAGRIRTVIWLQHTDAEKVVRTRQNLLRACQARGVRAFVV